MKKALFLFLALIGLTAACAGDSYWIWGAEKMAAGRSITYFRLPLDITDDVLEAEIFAIPDDACEIYLNGPVIRQVFFDQAPKRIRIRRYEFKQMLKPGMNVLSIITINQGGPGGIILKGSVRLANGKVIDLASNEQWKATMAPQKGNAWNKVEFDDSTWTPAFKLGDASMKPWSGMSDAVRFFGLPGGSK